MGINHESLQLASRIRMEYPRVEVTLIDENRENFMERNLGSEVYKSIKTYFKNRGVQFIEKRKFLKFETESEEQRNQYLGQGIF